MGKGDVFARLNREAEERRRKLEEAKAARLAEEEVPIAFCNCLAGARFLM